MLLLKQTSPHTSTAPSRHPRIGGMVIGVTTVHPISIRVRIHPLWRGPQMEASREPTGWFMVHRARARAGGINKRCVSAAASTSTSTQQPARGASLPAQCTQCAVPPARSRSSTRATLALPAVALAPAFARRPCDRSLVDVDLLAVNLAWGKYVS